MIKKICSVLLFLWVFCITSCFWYTEINNCYGRPNSCNDSNTPTPMSCREIENWEEFVYWNYTYKVDNQANVFTYVNNQYYNLYLKKKQSWLRADYRYYMTYRDNNWKLNIWYINQYRLVNLTLDKWWVCIYNSNDITDIAGYCWKNVWHEDCDPNTCTIRYSWHVEDFYNTNWWFDKIYFLPPIDNSVPWHFCYVKWETWYCILPNQSNYNMYSYCDYWTKTEDESFQFDSFNIENFSSRISYSPFNWQSWWWDWWDYNFNDLSSDAIRYFENMWFRKSMCYVWTNDLTTDYWSWIYSFQSWTWKTIFDLFESEYIDIDETDRWLQAVSNWLNSRLWNYDKRFSTDWQPWYKLFYSSVDELIHVNYYWQWDTPVFPFLNNPYAIYFMASNISTYTQYKSMFDYEGDEVVDYCNLKLNGWTFEDMISTPIKDSIVNNKSNNIWWNYFWSWSWGWWDWSFIWWWTGWTGVIEYTWTWSDLQFTGDVDLKSFFDNALNEMKNAIWNMQNPLTWVLPNYLIFALLLVVLFKILRH